MDRADAQFHPQPLAQEFLNSRPRQPEPQAQGDDQPRQAGADHPPFAQFHPGQQRIDFTPTRRRPGVMPAGAGHLIIAVVHHPQPQPRLVRRAPPQVHRLEAGIGYRPDRVGQHLSAAGANIGIVGDLLLRREDLGPAHPRRAGLLARLPGRFHRRQGGGGVDRRRLARGGGRLGRFCRHRRARLGLIGLDHGLAPVPRRPTARRARAVGRPLVQPLPRLLEIRQQPQRQPAQRLRVQGPDVGVIDLAQAVIAQVHEGGKLISVTGVLGLHAAPSKSGKSRGE